MVRGRSYIKRCEQCRHTRDFDLPQLRKALLYLDQYVLSELLRSDQGVAGQPGQGRDNEFWDDLHALVMSLNQQQQLVCPSSSVHSEETAVFRQADELKQMLRFLACDTMFYGIDDIRCAQLRDSFNSWLRNEVPEYGMFSAESVVEGHLHHWLDTYHLGVSFGPPPEEHLAAIRESRSRLASRMESVAEGWRARGADFDQYFSQEIEDFGPSILGRFAKDRREFELVQREQIEPELKHLLPSSATQMLQVLHKGAKDVGNDDAAAAMLMRAYLKSDELGDIPFLKNQALLYAGVASQFASGRKKRINNGFVSDVEVISTLAPYCDAMIVDQECHNLLLSKPIANRFVGDCRFFSMRNKEELLSYLRDLEYLFGEAHLDGTAAWFSGVLVGYDCCLSQLSGSRLGSSDRRVVLILAITSRSHVHGFAPQRLADSIRVYAAAAQ